MRHDRQISSNYATVSLFDGKKLIRESRWMRVYRYGENGILHASKFLFDGLTVPASFIKDSWQSFPPEERLEFAHAFSAKPDLTAEDEEILNFLMQEGSEEVWFTIATRLAKHSDRDRVFRFLIERVERGGELRGNYVQALELLSDVRAIPVLRRLYQEYRREIAAHGSSQVSFLRLLDYLVCCGALLALDGSPEFKAAIAEMLTHPVEAVRRQAEQVLQYQQPGTE